MGHFSLYSYLGLLARNLRAALQGLGAEEAARHEASLLRFSGPQGGFRGRRGGEKEQRRGQLSHRAAPPSTRGRAMDAAVSKPPPIR